MGKVKWKQWKAGVAEVLMMICVLIIIFLGALNIYGHWRGVTPPPVYDTPIK